MDIPSDEMASHHRDGYHKKNVERNRHNRAMQLAEADRRSAQAQALFDRIRMNHAGTIVQNMLRAHPRN